MGTLQQEIEKLRQAMAVLEEQRPLLGDAVVEPALQGLRHQLAALQTQLPPDQPPTPSVPHSASYPAYPAEERRLITIFFSDVVGSTSLAERLDPEEWHTILDRLLSTIATVVQASHGMVAQYLGDGLLAYFGVQEVSERDPEYAVRAALQAQQAVGGLGIQPRLHIRIGIHTGLAMFGGLGSAAWREYTAVGDTVNLAARLQNSAPPGGVLISHETFRCVRGVFDVSPQPLLSVKGKREPVRTYLVHRLKPRAFRTASRGVSGIETRTTGREGELAQLQAAYLRAVENGQEEWAQLIGEPGLGKSRLLDEMIDFIELRPEKLHLFRSRAYEGEGYQPYALIRRMWFDRFEIAEDAPLLEAETRWVDGFIELSGSKNDVATVEAAQALGLLVGLTFTGSLHIGGLRNDPSQLKGRAIVVSREFFHSLRRDHPIVLLLEDLHWADQSSWDYLSQVFLETDGQAKDNMQKGFYVLATARPEWTPPEALLRHPGYHPLNLSALTPEASLQLANELLRRVEKTPEDLLRLIVERAEGVPYFIEEMVNWLLDRGVIEAGGETWRIIPGRFEDSPFPGTLQHLLYARLSVLQTRERTVLQHGSIYGRVFWTGGLSALGTRSGEEVLERLQPRGFVDSHPESSFGGEREWSFHHNLVREITYSGILKRERVRLHNEAAAWLEDQARQAGRLDEFAGLIGDHLERAGEGIPAADWMIRAGDRAKARGATQEARQLYDRALALVPDTDRERRWQALLGRSETLSILGQNEARREDLDSLLALAQEFSDDNRLAEAYYHQGFFLANLGDDRAALPAFEASVVTARRAGNWSMEALVLALEAISLNRLGKRQAAETNALKILANLGELDDKTLSRTLTNIAVFYTEIGDIARGIELLSQSVEVNHRLGDRYGEAIGLGNLGYDYVQLGLPEKARAALERAVDLAKMIGARQQHAYHLLNLGLAFWRSGDTQAAQRALAQAIPEISAIGDSFGQAASLSYQGHVLEGLGQESEAYPRFAEAQEIFTRIGMPAYGMDALSGLARCDLSAGLVDQARQRAGQVWEFLQQHGPEGMEFPVWAYLTCARIYLAASDDESSRSTVRAGYRELITRAEKISDLAWRKSFLENIPEHRVIASMWRDLSE